MTISRRVKLKKKYPPYLLCKGMRVWALVALLVATATGESISPISAEQAARGYPILDALVASGVQNSRLNLRDMLQTLTCAENGQEAVSELLPIIPQVIEKALAKSKKDRGRIVEYTDEVYEVSENYAASIQGATLACYVVGLDPNIGPAAYASQIVVSLPAGIGQVTSIDPKAYNVSMLMEADVMELPVNGQAFLPKRYCLDLEDDTDFGISLGLQDRLQATHQEPRTRSILLGNRPATLTTLSNRVALVDGQRTAASTSNAVHTRGAYKFPKAELLGLLQANENGCVTSFLQCAMEGCNQLPPGLTCGGGEALVGAQAAWLYDIFNARRNETDLEDDSDDILFFLPFVAGQSIAAQGKNSLTPASQMNPFWTDEELLDLIFVADEISDAVVLCVHGNSDDSSLSKGAALLFPGALKRRLFEFTGTPQRSVDKWSFHDMLEFSLVKIDLSQVSQLPNQEVSWEESPLVLPSLAYGNLTEKVLGKTADWLMVTGFLDIDLQQLMLTQMESLEAFTTASSEAVVSDSPCRDVAEDEDIIVLVLAMATAACGGVQAVLSTVHSAVRWIYLCWRGGRALSRDPLQGLPLVVPTYEFLMVVFGACIFVGLYYPAYLQVRKEREVADFRTIASDITIDYGVSTDAAVTTAGTPVLITLAHVETTCQTARPDLLLALLVAGAVFGVLINVPSAHRAWQALCRYLSCVYCRMRETPEGTLPTDDVLRLLDDMVTWEQEKVAEGDRATPANGEGECVLDQAEFDSTTEHEETRNVFGHADAGHFEDDPQSGRQTHEEKEEEEEEREEALHQFNS